jgi:hypothetical protein
VQADKIQKYEAVKADTIKNLVSTISGDVDITEIDVGFEDTIKSPGDVCVKSPGIVLDIAEKMPAIANMIAADEIYSPSVISSTKQPDKGGRVGVITPEGGNNQIGIDDTEIFVGFEQVSTVNCYFFPLFMFFLSSGSRRSFHLDKDEYSICWKHIRRS